MKWVLYVVGILLGVTIGFFVISGEVCLTIGDFGLGVGSLVVAVVVAALAWLCLRPVFRGTGTPPGKGSLMAKIIAAVLILGVFAFFVSTRWTSANYQLKSTQSRINDALVGIKQGRAYLTTSDFDKIKKDVKQAGFWVPSEDKARARASLIELQRATQEYHEKREY